MLCWFYRIEFYPFTSWHLYEEVRYFGEGRVQEGICAARVWRKLPCASRRYDRRACSDARYSRHIQKCFSEQPGDVEICKTFLSAAASAYNKKAQPSERVTQYEIQEWIWDFLSHPSDPNYGELTDRFIFEINTGRALREKKLEDRSVKDAAPPLEPML